MFEINGKYTIYAVNSMAFGSKTEITISDINPSGSPIFKYRGKRKQFYLKTDRSTAVFKGWDLPFFLDSDKRAAVAGMQTFVGNACLNFVGSAGEIREWFEKNQLNPGFNREIVIAVAPQNLRANDRQEAVVFPEAVTHTHAVVSSILKKKEAESNGIRQA